MVQSCATGSSFLLRFVSGLWQVERSSLAAVTPQKKLNAPQLEQQYPVLSRGKTYQL